LEVEAFTELWCYYAREGKKVLPSFAVLLEGVRSVFGYFDVRAQ
jgi:hypothetical protein